MKVAVVTGANRGLGLETCRQLAHLGYEVVLTSRDQTKGEQAVQLLANEGLTVYYHPLAVTEPTSIQALADFLKSKFGRLDALVNNAGVLLDSVGSTTGIFQAQLDTLRTTMEVNVYGPLLLCQTLVPLMQGQGRIVNVSSGMGQLVAMTGGYPAYRLSKTALNALTRILADELHNPLQNINILVNAVCPGWVHTDMGGPNAPRTPAQGADSIVWLATLPEDGPTGGFFRDRQPIPW
jgi:NAD(P)-dependent dehydrogenase (short-subunit alcohol dehydrogenase family)